MCAPSLEPLHWIPLHSSRDVFLGSMEVFKGAVSPLLRKMRTRLGVRSLSVLRVTPMGGGLVRGQSAAEAKEAGVERDYWGRMGVRRPPPVAAANQPKLQPNSSAVPFSAMPALISVGLRPLCISNGPTYVQLQGWERWMSAASGGQRRIDVPAIHLYCMGSRSIHPDASVFSFQ